MGACGCSDFGASEKVGGFGVQVYPGCDYCDSPAGVDLSHLEWIGDEADELTDRSPTEDNPILGVAVIGAEQLVAALREFGLSLDKDDAHRVIRDAVFRTTKDYPRG